MSETWKKEFKDKLIKKFGDKANALFAKYKDAFHYNYMEEVSTDTAIEDMEQMELLSPRPARLGSARQIRKANWMLSEAV